MPKRKPKQQEVRRYPWEKWFRRKEFTLKRNVDYTCMPHSMTVQIRMAASSRGLSVSVFTDTDGTITARRYKKGSKHYASTDTA